MQYRTGGWDYRSKLTHRQESLDRMAALADLAGFLADHNHLFEVHNNGRISINTPVVRLNKADDESWAEYNHREVEAQARATVKALRAAGLEVRKEYTGDTALTVSVDVGPFTIDRTFYGYCQMEPTGELETVTKFVEVEVTQEKMQRNCRPLLVSE